MSFQSPDSVLNLIDLFPRILYVYCTVLYSTVLRFKFIGVK